MISIGEMTEYDPEIAEEMGRLLCDLSSSYNGEPVAREIIEEIIDSPLHDIIVAFDDEKLVGMASVSVILWNGKDLAKPVCAVSIVRYTYF